MRRMTPDRRRGDTSTPIKALSIRAVAAVALLATVVALLTIVPQSQAHDPLYWGSTIGTQLTGTRAPWAWNAVNTFQKTDAGGKPLSVLPWGSPFHSTRSCSGYCRFQTAEYTKVRHHGMIPWLSWSSYDTDSRYAPGYTDAEIAAGSQDAYITRWARAAKAWGHPFFLRFDWEMNLNSFGWGVGANGNTAADYVAMWRHVHGIFTSVHAGNVTWVWCPNDISNSASLASVYPGSAYVDWTCLDGYNGDTPWISFAQLFGRSYKLITTAIAPSKPMMIGEVGTTESGGNKAHWITGMFSALRSNFTRIRGFLWFESNDPGPGGHTDWRIGSSGPSRAAFIKGIRSSTYRRNIYAGLGRSPIPPPS